VAQIDQLRTAYIASKRLRYAGVKGAASGV
jgi:hypothetical protein